jgi:uncharacterized protein (TIGR04255 family)
MDNQNTSTMTLPTRLKKAPLLEAVFEVRFQPIKESAGDLLPGILYEKLGKYYGDVRPLPLASVPREFRNRDANLHYRPAHQLLGAERQLQVGDRVALVSQDRSYKSWSVFRAYAQELVRELQLTNLIEKIVRYSLKYVNLIPAPLGQQLSLLNAKFELAGEGASEKGFFFRTEYENNPWLTILTLGTRLKTREPESGLIVEVDTIRADSAGDLFEHVMSRTEELHTVLKPYFFRLLTQKTLEDMEPVWEESDDAH